MTIRDFKSDDRAEFLQMCSEFYSGDAVDHAVNPSNFTLTFEQIMQKNIFLRGLIIEYNGSIAGYCQLSLTWSNEAGGLTVWIEELYIKPEFRNFKLGSGVIDYIKNEYKNAARFRLEVSLENDKAMRLYKRMGFQELPYRQMVIDK